MTGIAVEAIMIEVVGIIPDNVMTDNVMRTIMIVADRDSVIMNGGNYQRQ